MRVHMADIHSHFASPEVLHLVDNGEFYPYVSASGNMQTPIVEFRDGDNSFPVLPAMIDVDNRLRHMDAIGTSMQLLSTWNDLFGYSLPEDVSARWHRAINRSLAAVVQGHPSRFGFLASVPLPWGESAAEVLTEAVEGLGAVGCMIGTNVEGSDLDDRRLIPFWEACDSHCIPVQLHPVGVLGQRGRLRDYWLSNFIGNPTDTTIAATKLILSGILDKYKNLQIVLVHGGGFLPYALGRITHGCRERLVAPLLERDPIRYLDRFWFDCLAYDERILRALAGVVGIDHIMMGTDYPFDMEPRDLGDMVVNTFGKDIIEKMNATTRHVFKRLYERSGEASLV